MPHPEPTSEPVAHYPAHYLTSTARLFGWAVATHPDGSVRLSLPDRTVWAHFAPDGSFRHGTATGGTTADTRLDLRQVLDVLEEHGSAVPPAPH
ncbi:hypothetical protein [Streptodolium elevatio]|uniref:Uncharacterized protein n=1 Tax=Streptodolium elevatio TaxID=3157996 RepID=A0ABV3DV52_9ACTN